MPNTGQGNRPKTVAEYEAEAVRSGECLLHPSQAVARRVFTKRHGEIPAGCMVCHSCDNPQCIEDSHHWLGTARSNMEDKMAKGRWGGGRPARISARDVRRIRSAKSPDEKYSLAVELGVTVQAVNDIASGRRRSSVT